jgi:hypothetical protein
MYSLALIIFVVSEKIAFEVIVLTQDHMGKYRNIFFSEAIALIEPKLCINHWKVLYKLRVFYVDRNSKMNTIAEHSFYTIASEKKIFLYFPIWSCVNTMTCGGSHLGFRIGIKNPNFLEQLYVFCSDMKFKMAATAALNLTLDAMGKMFQNTSSLKPLRTNWSYVKTMSCSCSHLGIPINIKNTKFVKDLPMIDAQFRFNQCNSFREENTSNNFLCKYSIKQFCSPCL